MPTSALVASLLVSESHYRHEFVQRQSNAKQMFEECRVMSPLSSLEAIRKSNFDRCVSLRRQAEYDSVRH